MITSFTTIESLLANGLISMRTYNCLGANKLYTMGDILNYIGVEKKVWRLLSIRHLGRKSLTEIQKSLSLMEKEIQSSYVEEEPDISPINNFIDKYNELIKNDVYRLSIENYYHVSKNKLSIRAVHFMEQNFGSILEIASSYIAGLNTKKIANCGRKTNDELTHFIANLYNYISSLFTENSRTVEISLFKETYPFLEECEIEFIINFKKRMLRLPMFYILYHYVIRSNSRFEKLLCKYYGIGCPRKELKDISASLNLSFERCRQLLRKPDLKDCSLITSSAWSYYDFLDDILFYNNFDYKSILVDEGLGHLSMLPFIGLCSLVKDIKVYLSFASKKYSF